MHRAFAFFGFILLALGASFAPAHAVPDTANTCFSNWSDAAPIVARERLLAARDVQEMSRRTLPGDVVRITLCREEAFFYSIPYMQTTRTTYRPHHLACAPRGGITV